MVKVRLSDLNNIKNASKLFVDWVNKANSREINWSYGEFKDWIGILRNEVERTVNTVSNLGDDKEEKGWDPYLAKKYVAMEEAAKMHSIINETLFERIDKAKEEELDKLIDDLYRNLSERELEQYNGRKELYNNLLAFQQLYFFYKDLQDACKVANDYSKELSDLQKKYNNMLAEKVPFFSHKSSYILKGEYHEQVRSEQIFDKNYYISDSELPNREIIIENLANRFKNHEYVRHIKRIANDIREEYLQKGESIAYKTAISYALQRELGNKELVDDYYEDKISKTIIDFISNLNSPKANFDTYENFIFGYRYHWVPTDSFSEFMDYVINDYRKYHRDQRPYNFPDDYTETLNKGYNVNTSLNHFLKKISDLKSVDLDSKRNGVKSILSSMWKEIDQINEKVATGAAEAQRYQEGFGNHKKYSSYVWDGIKKVGPEYGLGEEDVGYRYTKSNRYSQFIKMLPLKTFELLLSELNLAADMRTSYDDYKKLMDNISLNNPSEGKKI